MDIAISAAPARKPGPAGGNEVFAIQGAGLVRRFGATTALAGVDLAVRRGEFFSLLGPSGCGKTTLLRLIAGLDRPDEGMLRISGVDALPIPAHERPVNTVFQSYALFPHLSVVDNIRFGLRMKRLPKKEIRERSERIMDLVQIKALHHRRPSQLSGGEKQRVALARAIVNEPEILLLDEPLGALDLKLRKQLQLELQQLQRRLGITFVYVTHDQDEALTLSDRIAVLNAGRMEQLGTGEELYERPANRFVAQFLGGCNLIDASVEGTRDTGATVSSPYGRLILNAAPERKRVTLAIRPEKVVLGSTPYGSNTTEGRVQEVLYNGSETHYLIETAGGVLRTTVLNARAGINRFVTAELVQIHLPPEALIVLAD